MIHIVSKEKTYIPAFNKNRELPSNEQIVVAYKAPTMELKNRIVRQPVATADYDEQGKSRGMKIELKTDTSAYLRNMIIRVDGLGYQEEGKEVKYIRTAEDLLKAPLCYEPLVNELTELFQEELKSQALDEKN
jgi:hypothetical protein